MVITQNSFVSVNSLTGTFNFNVRNYCHSKAETRHEKFLKHWLVPIIASIGTLILASADLGISFIALPLMALDKNHWKNLISLIWVVVIFPFKLIANIFCLNSQPSIDYLRPFLCMKPANRLFPLLAKNLNNDSIQDLIDYLALNIDTVNDLPNNFKAALAIWKVLDNNERENILPNLNKFINKWQDGPLFFILKNDMPNFMSDESIFSKVFNASVPYMDLNATDRKGNPALFYAVKRHAVKTLIEVGIDPNKIIRRGKNKGKTVFEAAIDIKNRKKISPEALELLLSNMTITPRLREVLNSNFYAFYQNKETVYLANILVSYVSHEFLTTFSKKELIKQILYFSSCNAKLFALLKIFLEFAIEKHPTFLKEIHSSDEFDKIFTKKLVNECHDWNLFEILIPFSDPVENKNLLEDLFLNAANGSVTAVPLLRQLLDPANGYIIGDFNRLITKAIHNCHYTKNFEIMVFLSNYVTDSATKKEMLFHSVNTNSPNFVKYYIDHLNIAPIMDGREESSKMLSTAIYLKNFYKSQTEQSKTMQEIIESLVWNGSILPLSASSIDEMELERCRQLAFSFFEQIKKAIESAKTVLTNDPTRMIVRYLIWEPEKNFLTDPLQKHQN